MIDITNIHKSYGNKKNLFEALKGIDLTIKDGESIAIIGKSGSGKSTLMHLLAGLDTPTQGTVTYDDINIAALSSQKLAAFRNHDIGFVFQQFFLQPQYSALENVVLPLKIRGIQTQQRNEKGLAALQQVQMEDKIKAKTVDLSGGQKQRVCIARAIVNNPKVIFADEPTGNLDTQTGSTIIDLLFDLNKKGITLVIVTHDEDLAKRCDRQVQIQDGKIVHISTSHK